MPQPYFVPVRPICSRMTHKSGVFWFHLHVTNAAIDVELCHERPLANASRSSRSCFAAAQDNEIKGLKVPAGVMQHSPAALPCLRLLLKLAAPGRPTQRKAPVVAATCQPYIAHQ